MNEGMFSELKRLLGELIIRHDRMIALIESQMTQPLPDKAVAQAPVAAKTMPKEEPQAWPNYDPPHPTETFLAKRATTAPMRPTKK